MNYRRDKFGNELSILGFGCMRFKSSLGKIDVEKAEKEILYAIENGINYFDTAYIYPGSEELLGTVLQKHKLRDKVYIATKLPHYLIKKQGDLDRLFNEELKRLKTDHVDYYLMHMLSNEDAWKRLKTLGLEDWISEKKKSGVIRQIGFSYHGNSDTFIRLINVYTWDFCMIQYNYMDENTQAGKRGLRYANSKGIPVMIMEPLRGGKLVSRLPSEATSLFEKHERNNSPAAWAFKWLWNQPEVTVVLSGMNSIEMIEENTRTASNSQVGDLNDQDEEMLKKVVKAINAKMKIGCTGCGYCMPCPQNVDIPLAFSAYNRRFQEGKFPAISDYFICTALRKNSTPASNCIRCGKCEKHCPQGIEIRKELKNVSKEFEGVIYKGAKIVSKFFKF